MKITIQTNADFTPAGKRTAKIVQTTGMFGKGRQLRWYVGGRIYQQMRPTVENIELTQRWLNHA